MRLRLPPSPNRSRSRSPIWTARQIYLGAGKRLVHPLAVVWLVQSPSRVRAPSPAAASCPRAVSQAYVLLRPEMEPVRLTTEPMRVIILEEEDQWPRASTPSWNLRALPYEMVAEAIALTNEWREEQEQHHREEESYRPVRGVPASREAVLALRETGAADARQEECAVCLKDFEAEDKLRTMPCDHSFHQGCIFEWLRVSCVCPLCRQPATRCPRSAGIIQRRRPAHDHLSIHQN